jgi:superfamily II DNA helicase RecQ
MNTQKFALSGQDPIVRRFYQLNNRHFKYAKLHSYQKKAAYLMLTGKDSIVVRPTGGGKSLCYQVICLCIQPLLLIKYRQLVAAYGRGMVVVISPLRALIKDQGLKAQKFGLNAVLCLPDSKPTNLKGNFVHSPDWHLAFLTHRYRGPG